jgi:small ligand-binding sensory domain FIST
LSLTAHNVDNQITQQAHCVEPYSGGAQVKQAFEIRNEKPDHVVQALANASVARASTGLLFLTGKLASAAEVVARGALGKTLLTEWLIVPSAGVISNSGEIEGESGAVGLLLPVRGDLIISPRPDRQFGTRIVAQMRASAGSTTCVFVQGDVRSDEWLVELHASKFDAQDRIYGGGTLPKAPIFIVRESDISQGHAAALILPGRTVGQVRVSSAGRLLSPLGKITRSVGPLIEEIDHVSALERLRQSTQSLEEGSLVLLALGAGDRPLDPAGRSLALWPIIGVDPTRGAILLSDTPPPDTPLAFAVRDSHAARTDFEAHLRNLRKQNAGNAPGFGIYISCAGRGRTLYQSPDVDSRLISTEFPGLPFVGMHSTFEIAPLGGRLTPQIYAGVLGVFSLPS